MKSLIRGPGSKVDLVEAKHSIKELGFLGKNMGLVVDHVFKIAADPSLGELAINADVGAITFGLDVAEVDLGKDIHHRFTVKSAGRANAGSSLKRGLDADTIVDMAAKAAGNYTGLGGVLAGKLSQVGKKILKAVGKMDHDAFTKITGPLKIGNVVIGEVEYEIYKYNSLENFPKVAPELFGEDVKGEVLDQPLILTKALAFVDLTKTPPAKDGFVRIHLGRNIDLSKLRPKGGGNVSIASHFDIDVHSLNNLELSNNFSLKDLEVGPFRYLPLKSESGK